MRVDGPQETVSLQDIEGCLSSRSNLSSYAKMQSDSHVRHFYTKYHDDVTPIAKQVFEGISDCIAREGKPARVYRQSWDGRMWFANDGGSHRSAAIRMIDAENGFNRPIPSRIINLEISPEFKNICQQNSLFIFEADNPSILLDHMEMLKANGHILSHQRQNKEFCLIVPKDHKDYASIKATMESAFDFSDWVLNPSHYDKYEANHPQNNPSFA